MAYLDATTRLGLGGSSAIQYVGFTARAPSPDIIQPRGGSSDPALAERLAAERGDYQNPMLKRKLLREDEEVLSVIVAITERLH